MQNRIVEIASDDIRLSLARGFLKLSREGQEIGRIAFPDIGGVIVRGYGASLSLNVAARLASENIPIILCGADQSPASVIWPINGHHAQGHIMEAQSRIPRPKQKRLWQALIKAKISAQAEALEAEGKAAADLHHMKRDVRSGDPDNYEAQAARKYWPRMMADIDEEFKRDNASPGLNTWLNYGYAILRAGAARSILSAGLHPSLSIHHESRGEALRLSSDIMEPFRPWVDLTVRRLALREAGHIPELDRDKKAAIIEVLNLDLETKHGASPVQTCLNRLCKSFAHICMGDQDKLDLPSGLVFKKRGGRA